MTTVMTNTEYDQIIATTRLYIDGFNERDVEKFKSAFHEDAWMFYIDPDGKLHNVSLEEKIFRSWATNNDKGNHVELRILSVTQMGDVANVILAFGHDYLDSHNMVRVDGEWKITNKTACHRSRTELG